MRAERRLGAMLAALLMLGGAPAVAQQSAAAAGSNSRSDRTAPSTSSGTTNGNASGHGGGGMADPIGNWPRLSFETIANLEASGMYAPDGPDRPLQPYLRFDSTFLADLNDQLSVDALFQFKARQPRPASDPNRDLFINQGAGRRVGGKFKELYVRLGTWRVGKFVQDFGRAYVLAPGPFSADFVEEPDQGYEPSEMIGIEKIHVLDTNAFGWQQISVAAFMVDRTFLHRSFPYDEGQIHYRDGGIGNTHLPENVMVTYDILNAPVGRGMQASFQASAIRWGKTYGAERREFWTTLGADLAIPLDGSVEATLGGHYSQLRLYVEGVHRSHFNGVDQAGRSYLTGTAQLLSGRWEYDLTTTHRWTTDPVQPTRRDHLVTGTLGYNFDRQRLLLLSVANEAVGDRHAVYAGLRLQTTLTTCSRCQVNGPAY